MPRASCYHRSVLLLISLVSTWYLIGLVWFVQAVAYPQFARVAVADFAAYHRAHTAFTSLVVLPPMAVELTTAIWLVCRAPHDRIFWVALGLVAVAWITTFAMAVPAHGRLRRGRDTAVIRRLVAVNWIRAIAWTLRGVVLLVFASTRIVVV